MAFFNGWPFTQFQEQNLDWLIRQVKANTVAINNMKDNISDIMDEWLQDGTIQALVQDSLDTKLFWTPDLLHIDFTPAEGDLVLTGGYNTEGDRGSGLYIVNQVDGLSVNGLRYMPIYAQSSLALGIVADGVTDNTQAIRDAIGWVDHIDFLPDDVVMLSGSVPLQDDLTLNGNGCMIAAGVNSIGSGSYMLYGTGRKNIKIKDIVFNRQSSTNDFYAISLPNSDGIVIDGCEFINGTGYMCRLSGNTHLRVTNCKASAIVGIVGNPGGLFYIQGGSDIFFDNIYTTDIEDHAIYIDGSVESHHINIQNVIAKDYKIATALTAAAVVVLYGNTHDFLIQGIIADNVKTGISLNVRNNKIPYAGMVTDCNISNTNANGIESIGNANTVAIETNNVIQNNNLINIGQDGIDIRYQKKITVQNNHIENAYRWGIGSRQIEDSVYNNNMITGSEQGMTLGSSGTPVIGSVISNNLAMNCNYGIRLVVAIDTGNYLCNNMEINVTNPTASHPAGNYESKPTFTPT